MRQKWGESFLKSGLPLEHLALMTFNSLGWECEPKYEYLRVNRSNDLAWFELDLTAYAPFDGKTQLRFLVECKYHDEQRFWFFLPCTTVDHQAQYGAMSAGENLEADKYVVHCAPYCPLAKPNEKSLLTLAPKTTWGVTVSHSGKREENTIQTALEQLAYGFVPFCLDRLYHFCSNYPEAVIPMIVTTAKLFCLRPDSQNVESLREAAVPDDIADELPWTWCYYAPRGDLLNYNMNLIDKWKQQHPTWRNEHPLQAFPPLDDQILKLWSSPHWILVANIDSLRDAAAAIYDHYRGMPTNLAPNELLNKILESLSSRSRQSQIELD